MTDTVRESKRADELKPGDWIAAGPYTEAIDGTDDAEVLFVYPYGGDKVAATIQEVTVPEPITIHLFGAGDVELLTDEEVAALRADAERAKRIADLRAVADWLEERPWLPVPHVSNLVHLHGPEGLRTVRSIAERMGLKVDEHLDDRTEVVVPGPVYYDVIAWHKDGRPVEPAPVLSGAVDPDSSMEAHYDAEIDAPPMHYILSGQLACGVELTDDSHFSMLRAQVTCFGCRAATETEASQPPARFWPGYDVVRKGGMPAGFPPSLRVTRVIPIDGSGITTPQRWQFQAAGRNEWFHCDEYERAV